MFVFQATDCVAIRPFHGAGGVAQRVQFPAPTLGTSQLSIILLLGDPVPSSGPHHHAWLFMGSLGILMLMQRALHRLSRLSRHTTDVCAAVKEVKSGMETKPLLGAAWNWNCVSQ